MIKAPTLTIEKYSPIPWFRALDEIELEYIMSNYGKPLMIFSITYSKENKMSTVCIYYMDTVITLWVNEITGVIDFSGEYQIKIVEDK